MPLRSAARRCPDATFLPADPAAYDAASGEVMGVLRDLGHPVEVWGWDEAYVGAGLADPAALAETIRAQIAAVTGLAASVGISDNKQRAKVATGFAKPDGVYTLTDANWMAVMATARSTRCGGSAPRPPKACRPGHQHGPATGRRRCRTADLQVRAAHRAVVAAARQGRRRRVGERPAVDSALPQPRRHLPRDLTDRAEMDAAPTISPAAHWPMWWRSPASSPVSR